MYLSTGHKQADKDRDGKTCKSIEHHIDKTMDDENLIVMGDFNGHIGLIGNQRLDRNGKFVKKLMDEKNMTLLNLEEKCDGSVTWEKNGSKSTIDFILTNNEASKGFMEMKIDEEKEIYDLSDHNLIQATFSLDARRERNIKTSTKKKFTICLITTSYRQHLA